MALRKLATWCPLQLSCFCTHYCDSVAENLLKKNEVLGGGRKLTSLSDSTDTRNEVANAPSSCMLDHKANIVSSRAACRLVVNKGLLGKPMFAITHILLIAATSLGVKSVSADRDFAVLHSFMLATMSMEKLCNCIALEPLGL